MPTHTTIHRRPASGGALPQFSPLALLLALACGLAAALALPTSLAAQVRLTPPDVNAAAPPARSVRADAPVYVAIPDVFPAIEARGMVVREPGIDLIVLREDQATVEALTMAMHVLRDARARMPSPTSGILVPITGFVVTTEVSKGVSTRLAGVLRRLMTAESVDLGSLGQGRRVRLPGR